MRRMVAATVMLVAMQAVQGQEAPVLRKGIWDLKKVINGRPYDTRKCMEPFVELIRQHEEIAASGCTYKTSKKAAGQWEINSRCSKTNSEGRRWESSSVAVVKVESETSYKMEVTGTTNTVPLRESVTGRWVGNCAE